MLQIAGARGRCPRDHRGPAAEARHRRGHARSDSRRRPSAPGWRSSSSGRTRVTTRWAGCSSMRRHGPSARSCGRSSSRVDAAWSRAEVHGRAERLEALEAATAGGGRRAGHRSRPAGHRGPRARAHRGHVRRARHRRRARADRAVHHVRDHARGAGAHRRRAARPRDARAADHPGRAGHPRRRTSAKHPARVGFPEHHPSMHSFLGRAGRSSRAAPSATCISPRRSTASRSPRRTSGWSRCSRSTRGSPSTTPGSTTRSSASRSSRSGSGSGRTSTTGSSSRSTRVGLSLEVVPELDRGRGRPGRGGRPRGPGDRRAEPRDRRHPLVHPPAAADDRRRGGPGRGARPARRGARDARGGGPRGGPRAAARRCCATCRPTAGRTCCSSRARRCPTSPATPAATRVGDGPRPRRRRPRAARSRTTGAAWIPARSTSPDADGRHQGLGNMRARAVGDGRAAGDRRRAAVAARVSSSASPHAATSDR